MCYLRGHHLLHDQRQHSDGQLNPICQVLYHLRINHGKSKGIQGGLQPERCSYSCVCIWWCNSNSNSNSYADCDPETNCHTDAYC